MSEPSAPEPDDRAPVRHRTLVLLVAPVAVMVAMGYVADALWPTLVQDHPLVLLGLSARNRYVVLVAGRVAEWSYYLVGSLRLLAPDPLLFAIGWIYGPAAIRWMERRSPTGGRVMRTLERWFARWGHPLVVIAPNNYVCLIAGASGMSPAMFAFLDVTGTVGRLALLQVVGDVFSGPIDALLGWIGHYRIPLLVVSTLLVAVAVVGELRRSRAELDELHELEDGGEPPDPPDRPAAEDDR